MSLLECGTERQGPTIGTRAMVQRSVPLPGVNREGQSRGSKDRL